MLFHRCQYAQVTLYPAIVVVDDVILNHPHKLLTARKTLAVIALSFQNTPKAFDRAVVNALGYSGHALSHLCLLQFVVEHPVCVLKTSVAMEQRMCGRVGFYSGIQGIKHKRIIIAILDNEWDKYVGKIENLGMESPDPAENYVQLPEETTQWDGTFTKEYYQKLVQRMYNGEYEVFSDSTTFPETEITATDYGSIK